MKNISLYPGNYDGSFTDSRFRFGCDWSIENENWKTAFLFDPDFVIVKDQEYFEKINEIIGCEDDEERQAMIAELEAALASDEDVAEIWKAEKMEPWIYNYKLTAKKKSTGEVVTLYDGINFQNFDWLAGLVGGQNSQKYINLNDDLMDGPGANGEKFSYSIWGAGVEPVEVIEFEYIKIP